MGIRDVAWKTMQWKIMKKHLGYSEDEMKVFRENPRNEDVLSSVPNLMGKTIIAEVVESHGCNSQHGVGDRFYFDGAGNLLTKLCPKKVCIYALNAATGLIFASNELVYAGVDPSDVGFEPEAHFSLVYGSGNVVSGKG